MGCHDPISARSENFTCVSTGAANISGVLQWVRQVGSTNSDSEGRVAVDNAGRAFLVGWVAGAVGGLAFAGGPHDVHLAAFNGDTGALLWSQMLGSSGDDVSSGVAADGVGSVYVTGHTTGSRLNGQLSAGGNEAFLVRYEGSTGAEMWTRLLGTAGDDLSFCIAVDRGSQDAVYVGGSTFSATAGSGLPGSAGGLGGPNDAFVARYAGANGSRVWVRQFGSNAADVCLGIAVFQSEIYATGHTTGVMAGPANAGSTDIFIAKFTALGSVAWTVQLGSSGGDGGQGIAVDSSGVYVTGQASSGLNGQPYAGGYNDAFLARYSHAVPGSGRGCSVQTRPTWAPRLPWTFAAMCSLPAARAVC